MIRLVRPRWLAAGLLLGAVLGLVLLLTHRVSAEPAPITPTTSVVFHDVPQANGLPVKQCNPDESACSIPPLTIVRVLP